MTDDARDDTPTPETPAPEAVSADATAPSGGSSLKRYALILGVIILALGVVAVLYGPTFMVDRDIRGLHSIDPKIRRAHLDALKNHEDKELVIERLTAHVQDEKIDFEVRRMCADLLHRHFNRLAILEGLLRDDASSIHTRGAVLRSLMIEPYFLDQIVTDPDFRVLDTLKAWLALEGDMTRMHAVQIAVRADFDEVMPLIRPLLARSGASMVNPRRERDLMIAAAGAVERFADCETLPVLMDGARSDADLLVRLRYMQIVDRTVFRTVPKPVCAGKADQEAFAAIVRDALGDEAHEVRMGASLILVRQPEWAEEALPRLREIVAMPKRVDDRDTGAERRHALEVLLRVGKDEDLARIPHYCHDPSVEVRSAAARSIKTIGDTGLEGCWIGLLQDETENQALWVEVIDLFYKWAKIRMGRLGFPAEMSVKAVQDPQAWSKDLAGIFGGQELVVTGADATLMRISRTSIAEDHFRWYARKLGLEQDQLEAALTARRAFYAAKAKNDPKAAQAALESAPRAGNLWAYEDAWIAKELAS